MLAASAPAFCFYAKVLALRLKEVSRLPVSVRPICKLQA